MGRLVFGFDYVLLLLAAENKWKHITSTPAILDLLSVLPAIAIYAPRQDPQSYSMLKLLRLLKTVRILRLHRLLHSSFRFMSPARKQMLVLLFTIASIIFCTASIIFTLQDRHVSYCGKLHRGGGLLTRSVQLGHRWDQVSFVDARSEEGRFRWHDALYFVIVTVTTIGYGDISPATAVSRMMTVAIIVVVFVVLPNQLKNLYEAMEIDGTYSSRSVHLGAKTRHVILTGHLEPNSVAAFLQELLHEAHFPKNRGLRAILLSHQDLSHDMKALLESAAYANRVEYLQGRSRPPGAFVCPAPLPRLFSVSSTRICPAWLPIGTPLVEHDLQRACIERASAVFILSDKRQSKESRPILQDEYSSMYIVSIHAYCPTVPIYVQSAGQTPMAKSMGTSLASSGVAGLVNELVLEEVKFNIMAQSVRCPGFSTLVCNLITSYSAHAVVNNEPLLSSRELDPWQREYLHGCSQQLYILRLCPRLQGSSFVEAAGLLYSKFGLVLIAIRSGASFNRGLQASTDHVSLYPGRRVNWTCDSGA
eukprot:scaffold8080_cov417-Prasinococcus_capsulatus_cf.AAC.3